MAIPLLTTTPKSHHEPAKGRRGDRILTTTEKLSLRAPERCVAISLLTITPKSHHEPAECRRGDRILATTEKPSLRAPERCVAIPLLTTTPKSHHEPAKGRRGDRISATTEKPSLRAPERCVAIPLMTTTQKVITSLPKAGVVIAYRLLWNGVNVFFNNQYYAGEYAIPHYVRNDTFGITMRVNICFLFVSVLGTTKKECHCEHLKGCVAIPLFAIHNPVILRLDLLSALEPRNKI